MYANKLNIINATIHKYLPASYFDFGNLRDNIHIFFFTFLNMNLTLVAFNDYPILGASRLSKRQAICAT